MFCPSKMVSGWLAYAHLVPVKTNYPTCFFISFRKDLLLASGLAALRQIVESLSKFMSPYLVQILNILTWSQLSVGTEANKSSSALRGQVKLNVASLRDEISKKITPRVLLPALDACFDQIFHSEKVCNELDAWTFSLLPCCSFH